jgi:hypothetical protein
MLKLIKIIERAHEAHQYAEKHNSTLRTFAWFQGHSFELSMDEFVLMWKLLNQVFNETYGSFERFKESGEDSLDMFDIRATNDEAGKFICCFEERINKLKVFM